MALPWTVVDSIITDEGVLELRRRGERDFLITAGGLVLMNSMANSSEIALGRLACAHLQQRADARVLVSGLGMGYTLRAVLDSLLPTARVVVAELNPVVVNWCKGPLAAITGAAVSDPRVTVAIGDVADVIRKEQRGGPAEGFDAIVLDLYKGPHFRSDEREDPLYGSSAIKRTREALKPQGVFAVWGENYEPKFHKRLKLAGFSVRCERPLRHAVFLAALPAEVMKKSGQTVNKSSRSVC